MRIRAFSYLRATKNQRIQVKWVLRTLPSYHTSMQGSDEYGDNRAPASLPESFQRSSSQSVGGDDLLASLARIAVEAILSTLPFHIRSLRLTAYTLYWSNLAL